MHYIRFLKSPKVIRSKSHNGPDTLGAKVTVTTDLGESFLLEDIELVAELWDRDASVVGKSSMKASWKGRDGMRSLEVNIALPRTKSLHGVRMSIRPSNHAYATTAFTEILGLEPSGHKVPFEGGIVAVQSPLIDLKTGQSSQSGLAERRFVAPNGMAIRIWEETGESIARHIWYAFSRDAGLMLSAYISTIVPRHPTSIGSRLLPTLEKTLGKRDLNVLELGAGCGIVGITLATLAAKLNQQYLLTDLPEASEILAHNISISTHENSSSSSTPTRITHHVLDWSQPLPASIARTPWHLVLIADCTYNPDVVPDLVATLARLRAGHAAVEIVVAMKIRHESESVFFDLMREQGFVVREEARFELPVLGGRDEEIEVFVFGCGEEGVGVGKG